MTPLGPDSWLILLALAGVMTNFLLYPLWILLLALMGKTRPPAGTPITPTVSVLVILRDAEGVLPEKINNLLSLDYPREQLEIVVAFDGPARPESRHLLNNLGPQVRFLESVQTQGKNDRINQAIALASGEILFFTDADARMQPDFLKKLLPSFADPQVGGVCGQRVIGEVGDGLTGAQEDYIRFDNWIKQLESAVGSISSNDGKCYAMRRNLAQPVLATATDDLYNALSVVHQGFRMVFAPTARAFICKPSRNPEHEIRRRRRIVCRSLSGIFHRPALLNPLRYGRFAICLLLNKVVRRLLPLFLLLLFFGSIWSTVLGTHLGFLLYLQLLFYGAAALYPPLLCNVSKPRVVSRLGGLIFYFTAGNVGVLLGLWDIFRGKRVEQWTPIKAD